MASVHFARLVGAGGFARTVAVKRAHPHLARESDFALMFLDEARLAARVRHPNVVPTLDVLQTGTDLVLVMEYVHGESLWKLACTLRERGERVPLAIAGAITTDMLHGLHAAHEATDEQGRPLDVVHRDISPHNMLVGVDGVTRLVDFGIAKAAGRLHSTRDSAVKGKYAYMAPEQARGEPVSRLSDTYSAAIVFWELLTGERLFAGKTDAETIHKCLVARVRRPSLLVRELDPRLDAIVEKGLSRDPAGRYATAREMALDIEACVPGARASEIGSWVARVAGAALAKRARVIAALEASAHIEEAMPSSEVAMTSSVAAARPSVARPVRTRRAAALATALVAVLGVTSAAVLLARRGASAEPSTVTAGAAAAASTASTASSASTASPASPTIAAPVGPQAVAATAPSSERPPAPSIVTTGTLPSRAVAPKRAPRPARAPSCDPPYSIDSAGRRIFRPECLR
jgi:serine/threonine-protein kinase